MQNVETLATDALETTPETDLKTVVIVAAATAAVIGGVVIFKKVRTRILEKRLWDEAVATGHAENAPK